MPFPPEHHVPLVNKDILSWYFDAPTFPASQPVYIDALDPSRHWTAAQCRTAIRRLAAGFRRVLGLKNGDCVCVYSFNSLDYPVLVNGIIGFGGVYTGCNPGYTKFELVHHLKTSRAAVVVVEPELLATCLEAAAEVGLPRERIVLFADQTAEEAGRKYGLRSWRELMEHGEMDWPRFDDEATARNTTAALLYSSGTTGELFISKFQAQVEGKGGSKKMLIFYSPLGLPKAAMLSHHNMITQQILFWEWKGSPWKKRRLVALPMFHAATAPLCHFSPLHSGDQMFILRRFELESFLQNIERHQITEGAFVPPMVHMIISSPLTKKYSLKSIRNAHGGAAPLDAGSQAQLKRLLADDAPFTQVWGMTETSCTCSCLPVEYGDETTGSVGKMLPNMSAKLCDDEGNDITADDVRGELCVKGPLVCQGYYLNPEANARDWDSEGYFHTGDIAYRSSESKLWYIVDRKKELIKVRGFQVSPSEVEAVLLTHEDIIDAAVIGVPAIKRSDGEEPRAYITLRPGSTLGEQVVHAYVAQRLARYKQCTGGIVIGKEIPKSLSGKKLKRILVEQAKKELALERGQAKI